jgi:hypothetical protein
MPRSCVALETTDTVCIPRLHNTWVTKGVRWRHGLTNRGSHRPKPDACAPDIGMGA